jgi:aminoglycoside phosphotransferase (APT) family kinase protein
MQASADQRADWLSQLAQVGYSPQDSPFLSGRPDGMTLRVRTRGGAIVVAKRCPERGAETFENMRGLWASTFGASRKPPGLPQPLDYLPEPGVLICEWIDGRPLSEAERISENHARGTIELLAALHACDLQPKRRRSARGIIRSVRRKADRAAKLGSPHAEAIRKLADILEIHRAHDIELVPSHGDFSPRNVLVAGERLVIIDWERLQLADPARDVAYFGISTWLPKLQRGRLPDRSLLEEAVRMYETTRPGVKLKPRLSFHIAAGLLRMACSLVELRPAEAYLVPALVTLAERELGSK